MEVNKRGIMDIDFSPRNTYISTYEKYGIKINFDINIFIIISILNTIIINILFLFFYLI